MKRIHRRGTYIPSSRVHTWPIATLRLHHCCWADSAVGEGESGTQWVAGPVVLGWLVCGVGLRARGAGQAWLGGRVVTQGGWTTLGQNSLPHFFPSFLILFYFFFYTLLHLVNYTCIHVLPLMYTYLGGQLGVIEVCGFHVNGLATYRY